MSWPASAFIPLASQVQKPTEKEHFTFKIEAIVILPDSEASSFRTCFDE